MLGYSDGSLEVRDLTGGLAVVAVLRGALNAGHTGQVRAILPGPSDYFFSGGDDGRMCVWQLTPPPADGAGAAGATSNAIAPVA